MSSIPPNFDQLIQACSDGDLPKVLELLPTTNPTWFKSAPLRTAAEHNHTDIVLALLPHSDANAHDQQALKIAISQHNEVLFDALLPLCPDVFSEKFYSIYATIYALWPEKLALFENTEISQSQYDMALQGLCYEATDPSHFMPLLPKTSTDAQKQAMIILLKNNKYELFDLVTDHNDPHNCVEAMVECLPTDYPRAKKLFKRCLNANVLLTDKVARHVLVYALQRLDWPTVAQAAPLSNCHNCTIMDQVVERNDLDVYTYFEQLGAPISSKSAEISANLGNKELTVRQINKKTVTLRLLDEISGQGWSDLLSTALDCMSDDVLKKLQHDLSCYGRGNPYFAQCVRNQHYTCLAQILSHTFVTHERTCRMGDWVFELAREFSTDPVFFTTLSANVSHQEIDQIVWEAHRYFMHGPTNREHPTWREKHVAVIENLLPFASQKTRIKMFEKCVPNCAETPQDTHAEQLTKAVALYMSNDDITPATQCWWDAYQAQKLNKKLSEMIGDGGAQGVVKKM